MALIVFAHSCVHLCLCLYLCLCLWCKAQVDRPHLLCLVDRQHPQVEGLTIPSPSTSLAVFWLRPSVSARTWNRQTSSPKETELIRLLWQFSSQSTSFPIGVQEQQAQKFLINPGRKYSLLQAWIRQVQGAQHKSDDNDCFLCAQKCRCDIFFPRLSPFFILLQINTKKCHKTLNCDEA